MLKKTLVIILMISCMTCLQPAYANATKASLPKFSELSRYVMQLHNPQHTLLVLDDDDTLTMMTCENQKNPAQCQYLGSPAWFSWQTSLPITSKQRVAKTMQGLVAASRLLFALNKSAYTSPTVPTTLVKLRQAGVRFLVETARDQTTANSTEQQFINLPVTNDPGVTNLAQLILTNALPGENQLVSLPSPYLPCQQKTVRTIRYEQGILYLAGQNKGAMLNCFLQTVKPKGINIIVFVDDTQSNVDAVYQTFKNNKHYQVLALHYTALSQHKWAFTHGRYAHAYQLMATQRWQKIQKTLHSQLLAPMF